MERGCGGAVSQPPFLVALGGRYAKLDLRFNVRGLGRVDIGLPEPEAVNLVAPHKMLRKERGGWHVPAEIPPFCGSARRRGVRPPFHRGAEALAPFGVICGTVDDAWCGVNSYGARRGRLRTGSTALGPHGPARRSRRKHAPAATRASRASTRRRRSRVGLPARFPLCAAGRGVAACASLWLAATSPRRRASPSASM